MVKSDSIKAISSALCSAQAEFPLVPKTKEVIVNSQRGAYTFKYAPLEQMIAIIRPILHKHGLAFTQGINHDTLETILMHTSGEMLAFIMPIADPGTSQAYGALITYRRRYSLKMILGIETDDDNSEESPDKRAAKKGIVSGKITPTNDAMTRIDKTRHEYVNRIASTIVDYFNAGQVTEAYRAYVSVVDQDEKIAVWSFLDSKMRRELKTIDAKEREANAESL